jgi:hypothetical protein
MVVGGWNDMELQQLVDQIKNINDILKCCKKKLKYEIIFGKNQVVAGMNYEIVIKYKKCKCQDPIFYEIKYFINLSGDIENVHLHKIDEIITLPGVCFIDYECKCKC